MKRVLVLAIGVFCMALFLGQKTASATSDEKNAPESKQEQLRISDRLVLPHYMENTGALSKEILKIDKPEGLRVKYLAPRLISSYIYVQTFNEFSSEEKSIAAQAQYFAEANVINLRRQGVDNTLLLSESFASKFSNTNVAYQRVIREDSNKVLHIYVAELGQKVIFIQAWADYKKEGGGSKVKFDTFVNDLVKDLERQV